VGRVQKKRSTSKKGTGGRQGVGSAAAHRTPKGTLQEKKNMSLKKRVVGKRRGGNPGRTQGLGFQFGKLYAKRYCRQNRAVPAPAYPTRKGRVGPVPGGGNNARKKKTQVLKQGVVPKTTTRVSRSQHQTGKENKKDRKGVGG